MAKSEVFLNSAIMVHDENITSCMAIFNRVGGHGFSNAAFVYRRMFCPPKQVGWWNARGPQAQQARIYALLLAHSMYLSGDL